jgi:hypothetical protein
LANLDFWDKDLTAVPNLCRDVLEYYNTICTNEILSAVVEVTND